MYQYHFCRAIPLEYAFGILPHIALWNGGLYASISGSLASAGNPNAQHAHASTQTAAKEHDSLHSSRNQPP